MGSQSDLIAAQFVPTAQYKAQQTAMAQRLLVAGLHPEQLASMFLVPVDLLAADKPKRP
jgi:hypothetical protein